MGPLRRADRLATIIIAIALAQLVCGVLVVRAQRSESELNQAVLNAQMTMRADNISSRVQQIEDLKVPERLRVLEAAAADAAEVRKLTYGVIVTLIGSLFAQLVQIRTTASRRRN